MKLTVLVENNTKVNYYFRGESAFSVLIEDGDMKMLFDVGLSDAFLRNALQMQKSLLGLDYIVLSHGHLDHIWGLQSLTRHYAEADLGHISHSRPKVIAHKKVFMSRKVPVFNNVEIGSDFTEKSLGEYFDVSLDKEPQWITDKWVFLGQIKRKYHDYEGNIPVGVDDDGNPDYVLDDSAIVYKSPSGLVIITGCAHSGICNTIDYAKEVCGDNRIVDVIGGFHLNNCPDTQLQGTVEYMKQLNPPALHMCHCVDLKSKVEMAKVANLKEVWVGLTLEY